MGRERTLQEKEVQNKAEEDQAPLKNHHNITTKEYLSPEAMPQISEFISYTKEAAIKMAIIKSVTTNTILIAEKLNMTVKTSDVLEVKIEQAIHKVDQVDAEFRKQTQGWWKQKWFTYTASTTVFLFVIYQMFQYKAVPNFLSVMREVSMAFLKSSKEVIKDSAIVDNLKDISKPNLENTIKAIAETPIELH